MSKLTKITALRCSTSLLAIMMLIISGLMMSSCNDDKHQTRYKVVNTDDFGDVPLYASSDCDEVIGYVSSRTNCMIVDEGCYGDGHKTKIIVYGRTAYVADRYVFKKDSQDEDLFIINPLGGTGNMYADKLLTQIKEWQDSDLHYSIDQMWLYGKLILWSIVFFFACIFAFSQISDNDRIEWWMQLIVIATGLILLYYEWQNAIVMGGGYKPMYTESYFNTQSLGWFLNLIVTILLALIYFSCAFIILIVVIFLQQFIVPMICITVTGFGKWASIGNALIFCSIYICGVLALLIGPDSYDTLLIIALVGAVIGIVLGIIGGYQTGNLLAILLIVSPILYLISMVTTYCIFKSILYVASMFGIILLVVGAAGTKSNFQSQDDGSTAVVHDQSGKTVGFIDKEGWHDGVKS